MTMTMTIDHDDDRDRDHDRDRDRDHDCDRDRDRDRGRDRDRDRDRDRGRDRDCERDDWRLRWQFITFRLHTLQNNFKTREFHNTPHVQMCHQSFCEGVGISRWHLRIDRRFQQQGVAAVDVWIIDNQPWPRRSSWITGRYWSWDNDGLAMYL